jgi:hypothetical protein
VAVALAHGLAPRRYAVVAIGLAVALSLVARQPIGVAAGLSVLAALAVMPEPGRRSAWMPDLLAWLPIGVATATSAGICVVIACGLLRIPLWGSGLGVLTSAMLGVALGAVALRRGGNVALCSSGSLIAWVPGLVVAAAAVFRFSQPMSYWSRPVWAVTDWMSHAEMVADLSRNRMLDYDPASSSAGWIKTVYPRGLHALLAWLAGDGGDGSALAEWERAIEAVSVAAAVLTVMAVVSGALLAHACGVRMRLPRWLIVAVTLVAALLMLHPYAYQPMASAGFLTTTGAAVLAFAAAMVAANGTFGCVRAPRVLLSLLLTVGMLYMWQVLALPLGILTIALAWRWWRAERDRPWLVGGSAVASAGLSIPLVVASLGITRIDDQVLNGGFVGTPGLVSFIICLAALVVVAWRRAMLGALGAGMGILVTMMLLLGILLIPLSGGSLGDVPYYAEKVLWHAGLLAMPVALAGATVAGMVLVFLLRERMPGSPLVRGVIVAAPVVLLLAYVGGGISYGVGLTIRTLAAPGGLSPQVPLAILDEPALLADPTRPVLPLSLHPQGWGPSFLFTDWHAAQLARYLGAEVPGEGTLTSHRLESVCTWLRAHPDATRLTGPTLGYTELLDSGCPEAVVRADQWVVVTTPPEWWRGTPWEGTGGTDESVSTPG